MLCPGIPLSTGPTPPARRRRPRHRATPVARRAAVALALLFVLAATACSNDDPDGPSATVPTTPTTEPGTTTVPEATTTTAAPTVEEQVESAYLAAQAAYFRAAGRADPDDDDLAATTTGPSLDRARELVAGFRDQGIEVRYTDDLAPVPVVRSVQAIDGTKAELLVCIVDDGRQVRVSDGSVVDDAVESRLNSAELRLVSGTWKLYSQLAVNRWPDGQGCDR